MNQYKFIFEDNKMTRMDVSSTIKCIEFQKPDNFV